VHEVILKKRKELAEQGKVLTIPDTITHIIDEWEVLTDGGMSADIATG